MRGAKWTPNGALAACRNLLIYLEPDAQARVLALMHFALREGGYLFLGNAETLGHADTLFEVVSKRWRILSTAQLCSPRICVSTRSHRRAPDVRPVARIPPPVLIRPSPTATIQAALLEEFGPPSAVVDANERIVYFHGDASPYLQVPMGETTQNLLDLVRPVLRPAVRTTLREAIAERRVVSVDVQNGTRAGLLSITAAPLRHSRPPDYFRVSFEPYVGDQVKEGPDESESRTSVRDHTFRAEPDAALEEEIRTLRRELQASVESFEAANEELKASNEEVHSINEELQSANEELETGKEELQAVNEELVTVNGQLQSKLLELEALTATVDIGT